MANTERTIRLNSGKAPDCGVAIGDVLAARYRLNGVLGWGGQAVVFNALDLQAAPHAAALALKVARRDLAASERAEAVTVLRWEAQLLRKLRHPALPRLRRFHSDSALTWLARDAIPGIPLNQRLQQAPCGTREVRRWAIELCDLLSYLHTQSPPVVCGDIKPANLILRPDGSLALIDLGAAHTLTRRPPKTARPRHGTPGYAPPEQLGNWGHDERSDLFSLAVTCYELLTGLDPAQAPLQFDSERLDAAAPQLAPALRWALTLDLKRRAPTATALRARLVQPAPAPPLRLPFGVSATSKRDLLNLSVRHPRLLEDALKSGAVELWLAVQPDAELGGLLYSYRAARKAAPARQSPIDTLLHAMAPPEGSAQLVASSTQLDFGVIPLRKWKVWSAPQTLVLHNAADQPQRWVLECPQQSDAEVRVLFQGRPQRQAAGVLAPGARLKLEIVAQAQAGQRSGALSLSSGQHSRPIAWRAEARAGITVGGRFVQRLDDLDFQRPERLLADLEALLEQGALSRWLRATGAGALAREIEQTMKLKPDEATRRLLIARILHSFDPLHFPLLRVYGIEPSKIAPVIAGEVAAHAIELENSGTQPCAVVTRSRCSWAHVPAAPIIIAAHSIAYLPVRLAPPPTMVEGQHSVALQLNAGAVELAIVLNVTVTSERWWQRLRRWVTG
jgi:serine/threonine protein kinase